MSKFDPNFILFERARSSDVVISCYPCFKFSKCQTLKKNVENQSTRRFIALNLTTIFWFPQFSEVWTSKKLDLSITQTRKFSLEPRSVNFYRLIFQKIVKMKVFRSRLFPKYCTSTLFCISTSFWDFREKLHLWSKKNGQNLCCHCFSSIRLISNSKIPIKLHENPRMFFFYCFLV